MRSLGYFHAFLLSTAGVDGLEQFRHIHTSGKQQESTTPNVAHTVLSAPDDGRKTRPKHVER
jgi:hypothetical protein